MAEPGGAVEVHGGVAVKNGAVTNSDPEALVAQIERTREDLARTIDTLAERVSPAHNVAILRDKVTAQMARPEVRIGAAAVGVGVVGLAILRIWARRRRG
jgi:Protein of unknown function (DUF3618)